MDSPNRGAARPILHLRLKFSCCCGKPKVPQKSLCDACWARLPGSIRAEFGRDFDSGYAQAVAFLELMA